MNDDKFLINRYIKDLILVLDDYLLNYPKKYFELRNRLINDTYELLELVYLANYSIDIERKKYQIMALMKTDIIDFYLEESFKKKIISEKQCIKLSNKLGIIHKMIYKWLSLNK